MQVPILGTLFKSRDYINHQTELMVLVTPYVVRAVAQKQLSRPDDGFADPSDPQTVLLGQLNRIYGVAGKIETAAHRRLSRQVRIHPRLSGGRRLMTAIHTAIVRRRSRTALRLLAAGGLAASLAGCYQAAGRASRISERLSPAPPDHAEGRRANRRSLSRPQSRRAYAEPARRRAVVRASLAARGDQRHHHRRAARRVRPTTPPPIRCAKFIRFSPPPACRPTRSTCAASGRARHSLASIKINYSKLVAEAGPCGQWPHDLGPSTSTPAIIENRPYWNLGCASQRNLAAMVDNPADLVQPRGETPAYAPRRSVVIDHYRKGDNPIGHLRWL